MVVAPPPADLDFEHLAEDERARRWPPTSTTDASSSGYSKIQGTKPQTIGYALDDSPAGLAGWIVEKFRAWTDCDGDVERRFTKDQLLDNVMLYWLTGTAHSAGRLYYEAEQPGASRPTRRVEVPGRGRGDFPKEIIRPPRRWAEPGTTCSIGPKCREVATSRRSRNPSCWSATSGSSSGPYGSLCHCARARSLGSTRATSCVKV